MQSWESSVWVREGMESFELESGGLEEGCFFTGGGGSTELAGIVDPGQVNMMKKHDHPRANGETMMMVWVADQEKIGQF